MERILKLFVSSGCCRLAKPGEFSYRALKNNKMTLPEVEGLDIFLNATSKGVLDQGMKLMGGEMTKAYLDLRSSFCQLRASLELSVDFLEDVGEEAAKKSFNSSLRDFSLKLFKLYRRTLSPLRSITTPEIVLVGKPNTGKSSLFNALLQETRSIVSPEEGTTRDYVSEYVTFQEIQFRLIDTAGIRETSSQIEREGIFKTLDLISHAFFKVLLVNPKLLLKKSYFP